MDYQSLGNISDIFNGIRITRYIDQTNENKYKKVFTSKLPEKPEEKLKTDNIQINSQIASKFYSQKNDILLQVIGSTKTTIITKEIGIIIPNNYIILRVHENYNPIFIYYLLKSVRFTDMVKKLSEGSNSRFLRIPDLKKIKLKIPDSETQNKYAELMQILDEKNRLEIKKLKIHKEIEAAIIANKLGDKYVKF